MAADQQRTRHAPESGDAARRVAGDLQVTMAFYVDYNLEHA